MHHTAPCWSWQKSSEKESAVHKVDPIAPDHIIIQPTMSGGQLIAIQLFLTCEFSLPVIYKPQTLGGEQKHLTAMQTETMNYCTLATAGRSQTGQDFPMLRQRKIWRKLQVGMQQLTETRIKLLNRLRCNTRNFIPSTFHLKLAPHVQYGMSKYGISVKISYSYPSYSARLAYKTVVWTLHFSISGNNPPTPVHTHFSHYLSHPEGRHIALQ